MRNSRFVRRQSLRVAKYEALRRRIAKEKRYGSKMHSIFQRSDKKHLTL